MKKKEKDKKKQDMPEFHFKEFTPEEDSIYVEAIAAGKTLRQAYESYAVADRELSSLIQADFLKIMIAERHFARQQPLEDIAKALDISLDLVKDAHMRMLQEVGVTAANQFGREYDDIMSKTND
jgi:hypothetical protein